MAMQSPPKAENDFLTLTWGMFLLLVLAVLLVGIGAPSTPIAILVSVGAVLFAFRYIYFSFYVAIGLSVFLGMMFALPVGQSVFGGSADMFAVEIAMFAVLAAWAMRLLLYWQGRNDLNWRPRLPVLIPYLALFLAHLASMFSAVRPSTVFTVQYSLRPVLFDYLAFIALPASLIRSRKRLVGALGVMAAVGIFAAAIGFVAVFYGGDRNSVLSRAHPIPIFGLSLLGSNHNELAEVMVYTSMMTWALSILAKRRRTKRLLGFAAAFQMLVGVLTFTRTFWIVSLVQLVYLLSTEWRHSFRRYANQVLLAGILLVPFGVGMLYYISSYSARSSNTTRLMMAEIAWNYFRDNPIFGVGAGTFIERLGQVWTFTMEFGAPLDSHGILQKIATETGLLGLAGLAAVLIALALQVLKTTPLIKAEQARRVYHLLVAGALGAFVYQIFNTDYWTGKMWLPIGLMLAAGYVLVRQDAVGQSNLDADDSGTG
jgi:hypothetical protein